MSDVVEAREPSAKYILPKEPTLVRSFEFLATARGGVAKLRELILMLAVRGKLEPQSQSEQSAQTLLSQIGAAKGRLLESGRIKRGKPIPEVRNSDEPWAIPPNWAWVRLGDLGQIVGGGTPKSDNHAMWSPPNVPWLTPADLYGSTEKYVVRGRRNISEAGLASSSAQLLPPGTVLFSSRAPIGYVAISAASLATNQGFKSCVLHLPSLAGYLYWFLKCSAKAIDAAASGTTFKEISGGEFSKVLVPLPPLAEQTRIVTRVEELMKLCDALERGGRLADEQHARLRSTLFDSLAASESAHALAENWQRVAEHFDLLLDRPEAVDSLEQTILELAVRGLLVPMEQIPGGGPPLATVEGSDPEAAVQEVESEFPAPKHWKWVRFGALWESSLYGPRFSNDDYVQGGGVPTVRTTDMSGGRIRLKQAPLVKISPKQLEAYRIKRGDLLVTRSGSIGVMALYDLERDAIPSAYLIRLRFKPTVLPEFGLLLLTSPTGQRLMGLSTTSVGVPNVNATKMAAFPVAAPDIDEQGRIVARVEELRYLCGQLRERLDSGRKAQARLADALVAEVA